MSAQMHTQDPMEWMRQYAPDDVLAAFAELIGAAVFARHTGNGPLGYTPGADRRLANALAGVGAA